MPPPAAASSSLNASGNSFRLACASGYHTSNCLGILLSGGNRRRKRRQQLLNGRLAPRPLQLDRRCATAHRARAAPTTSRVMHEYFEDAVDWSRSPSLRRPFRNSSSTRNASDCTSPPSLRTRAVVAAAVPPVASTSSTMSTRCPGSTASAWISRQSVPYSRS